MTSTFDNTRERSLVLGTRAGLVSWANHATTVDKFDEQFDVLTRGYTQKSHGETSTYDNSAPGKDQTRQFEFESYSLDELIHLRQDARNGVRRAQGTCFWEARHQSLC